MSYINYAPVNIGQVGTSPGFFKLETNDTLATIIGTGYLNLLRKNVGAEFGEKDIFYVNYSTSAGVAPTRAAQFEVKNVGSDWSLITTGEPGDVTLPTVANHIAVFADTNGTMTDDVATAINGGNIQAGLSGTAGTLASYPSADTTGSLKFVAVANGGDFDVTISNAEHAQATVYSIKDCGVATAELISSDSATTQNITSGNLQIDAGNLTLGSSGNAAYLDIFPATGSMGTLRIVSNDNAGNTLTTIQNKSHGQATVYDIPDVGQATGSFAMIPLADANPVANLQTFDVTVTQAALASAAVVDLVPAVAGHQYKIRDMMIVGFTNFSGGTGDRLGDITDGTTVFSQIPAAQMQASAKSRWGDATLPYSTSDMNTSSVAGQAIRVAYSGGLNDYTAGELRITGTYERVT